jgi:branched-chain amino acid transport system ATP-binding protein
MSLLEVNNLSKSFGGLHAVREVTFAVEAGTIHGIIGPNGAGKTTLFNCIAGSIRPLTGGVIAFNGRPIHACAPHEIARCGIARTFQTIKLFARMTVLENVMVGCHTQSSGSMLSGMLALPFTRASERAVRAAAMAQLDVVGIADLAAADAQQLSFGQQRSVELARALALKPKLLLLDEPASGLTMHETDRIGELICRIRDAGITILIVEHDMSLIMTICDRLLALSSGRRIAEGTPRQVQSDPEVIRVYLGGE